MRSSLLRPPGEKAEKGHFRSDKSNKSGEHDRYQKDSIDRRLSIAGAVRCGTVVFGRAASRDTACLLRSFDGKLVLVVWRATWM